MERKKTTERRWRTLDLLHVRWLRSSRRFFFLRFVGDDYRRTTVSAMAATACASVYMCACVCVINVGRHCRISMPCSVYMLGGACPLSPPVIMSWSSSYPFSRLMYISIRTVSPSILSHRRPDRFLPFVHHHPQSPNYLTHRRFQSRYGCDIYIVITCSLTPSDVAFFLVCLRKTPVQERTNMEFWVFNPFPLEIVCLFYIK